MADERAPVESYKIGPEEKRFLKRFRNVLRAEQMLQVIGQQVSQDMQNVMQLYEEAKNMKQQLLKVPPMIEEVPGQPQFSENPPENIITPDIADKWQIRY